MPSTTPASTEGARLTRLASRARELVTLREAEAAATRISPEAEAAVAGHVARIEQKARAAKVLAGGGAHAEGLRMAAEALAAAEAALTARAEAGAPADPDLVALVHETREALDAAPLPARDADVGPRAAALHDRALFAVDAARAFLAAQGSRAAIRRARWMRGAALVALVACVAGATAAALLRPRALEVAASGRYDGAHAPRYAVDNVPETEWLLPDGATGWLEVTLPRKGVRRVRVLNGHNASFNDRAVREWTVELRAGEEVLKTVPGVFAFQEKPEWKILEVEAPEADRVRFVVQSVHKNGAALAELNVDLW